MSAIEEVPQARADGSRGIAWGRVLQVVTLVLGLWVLALNVESLLHDTGLEPGAGRLGYLEVPDPNKSGWSLVLQVDPNGAAARAGVRMRDEIRLDRPEIVKRASRAGEVTGAVLERSGATRHIDMVALPIPRAEAGVETQRRIFVERNLASILPALFGLFIAVRSRGRLVPVLGASLLFVGASGTQEAPMWMTTPFAVWANVALTYVTLSLTAVASVAFAMLFAPEGERRLSRLQWFSLAVFAGACAVAAALNAYEQTANSALPALLMQGVLATVIVGRFVLVGANLVPALLKSPPKSRGRYALLLLAFALILGASFATNVIVVILDYSETSLLVVILRVLSGLVAPALFAYAILKDRVLDLGFAVNRTLVYGVVSALLLSTFGLVEWGVDHFVPIAGREKNVLVDAAVAVVVFLSFHRVRDFVEHAIEGLFFRRWQQAEAALRQFVKEAAFIEKSAMLTQSFMGALARFAEGAETALYVKSKEGSYRREDGGVTGVGETIDPDDPGLVALRAELKPRELEATTSTMKAALIAPMVNRNEVIGAVLLGPKPSGLEYRPDEIALIGWATRQVGLDLHALKIERLEEAAAEQRRKLAELDGRNQELRLALGVHAPKRV